MDFNKITSSVSHVAVKIVWPADRLGKITNLFFISIPVIYAVGRLLVNRFAPFGTDKLSSSERVAIRANIEEGIRASQQRRLVKFEIARQALKGKNEQDLWERLVLNIYSDSLEIENTISLIAEAPENLQLGLYKQLAQLAMVFDDSHLALYSAMDIEALGIEKEVAARSSLPLFSNSSTQNPIDKLLELAKEYRALPIISDEWKAEFKALTDKLASAKSGAQPSGQDHAKNCRDLKNMLEEVSRNCKTWIDTGLSCVEKISMPGDASHSERIEKAVLMKKEIDGWFEKCKERDGKEFSSEQWLELYNGISALLKEFSFFSSCNPSPLLNKAVALAQALPEDSPIDLKNKFAAYLKIVKFYEKILPPEKIVSFIEELANEKMQHLMAKIVVNQEILKIDRISLLVQLVQLPWRLPLKGAYLEEASTFVSAYTNEFLQLSVKDQDKEFCRVDDLWKLVQDMVSVEGLENNVMAVISEMNTLLETYSPSDEYKLEGKVQHYCQLLSLENSSFVIEKSLRQEIEAGLKDSLEGECFQHLTPRSQIRIYMTAGSILGEKNGLTYYQKALELAKGLENTGLISDRKSPSSMSSFSISSLSRTSSCSAYSSSPTPKFAYLRALYLALTDSRSSRLRT